MKHIAEDNRTPPPVPTYLSIKRYDADAGLSYRPRRPMQAALHNLLARDGATFLFR